MPVETLLQPVQAPVSIEAPSPPPEERHPLLGKWLTRPLHLLWAGALPQVLLLWLNVRAWHFISGEVNATQRTLAAVTLGAELLLLLGSVGLASTLHACRRPLGWAWNWPLLGACIGYLAWTSVEFFSIQPDTVPQWIVSSGEMLYYQCVLVMPLAFYAGLRLACFESRRSLGRDIGMTVLVGAGTVVVLLVAVNSQRFWRSLDSLPVYALAATLIVLTLLLLGALLRVLAMAYVGVRSRGPAAMAWLVALVGIAGPLGGLMLNRSIPFPVSFQSWEVYALAVANGLLLLLPNHRHPSLRRLVWLGQCALFPFSLYFFLVFLPVLPLSLLAMFWFGAGLLLIVPSALFVIHVQRLVDGYECEVRDGRPWVPALLGVAAALGLPAWYVGGAAWDRAVLRGALDYAYTPSYRADGKPFAGDPARVGRSLEHLRDFKAGLDLPFLTDLYKGVVFGGLVLPDEKMQHVYQVFLGRELPPADEGQMSIFGHLGTGRGRQTAHEVAPRFYTPSTMENTVLANLEQTTVAEGPCDRAHLTLTMENMGAGTGEFVTQVHLPAAARVTGFWLHVGPERVPGRLVERKTALWVYHRIRDAEIPRDPGLLNYTGPETVEVRVYPFASHERRTAEIELLYPAVLASSIKVGDRVLTPRDPLPAGESAAVLTPAGDAGATVTLTPEAVSNLPTTVRRPYLHFLLDRSAASDVDAATLRRAVQAAAARFPEAREGLLTSVNYECREPLSTDPMPLSELSALASDEKAFERRLPPLRGGFLEERSLRRGLLGARDRLARARDGNDPALGRYPIFVVVRGSKTRPINDGDEVGGPGSGGTAAFGNLVPEQRGYYVAKGGDILGALTACAFEPSAEISPTDATPPRTVLLRCGDETVVCKADPEHALTACFVTASAGAAARNSSSALNVFDPNTHAFRSPAGLHVAPVAANAPYARAAEVFLRYRALVEDPSAGNVGLARVAAVSRASGVLTGATSYLVVENSAQWKILEQKEKQKLANAPALEIEQTPEPGTWAMIVVGGAGLALLSRRPTIRHFCAQKSRPDFIGSYSPQASCGGFGVKRG